MKLYFECMPCVMNQITKSVENLIEGEERKYEVFQKCINSLEGYIKEDSCAPILGERYLQVIKEETGIEDIFAEGKKIFDKEMLLLEDDFNKIIKESDRPIQTALMLSGAANIIDFGVDQNLDKEFVKNKILEAFGRNNANEADSFVEELKTAKTLVYVGDNSGEIVLDKLVLENIKNEYPNIEIYYAVRAVPILNDVTEEEAYEIGIDKYAHIISSGSTLPGTVLSKCTPEFQELYKNADVKVLKGMGNVETASKDENDAYFVFMAKCNFMVNKLKVKLHDIICTKGNPLYR